MPIALIALTASLAIGTAVVAVLWPQPGYVATRLDIYRRQLDAEPSMAAPWPLACLAALRRRLAAAAAAIVPRPTMERLEQRLRMAGNPYNLGAAEFVAMTAAAAVLAPLAYYGLLALTRRPLGATEAILLALLVAMGFQLPRTWLGFKVAARQKAIARALPDAMDLITVCVEAGLALDAALARVGQRMEGPLSKELLLTLGEISLGRPRREALLDIGRRCGVADLSTFITAVIQADQMGVSIGRTLRVQSDELKTRRRQRAEAEAMRASTKMLIPLIFCIFPAVFVVAIGPAVIAVLTGLLK